MPAHTITITATGDKARAILEHIINPALKDCMCSVRWPGYPNTAEITVEVDDADLAFHETLARGEK